MHPKNLIPSNLPDKHVVITRRYDQFDSNTSQGRRMCNSSSHSMLVYNVDKTLLGENPNADDEYLRILNKYYGDSTNIDAQIACLKNHFHLDCEFKQNLYLQDVVPQLLKGVGVPVGTIHRGHYTNPVGGGHWMFLLGWDFRNGRDDLIFHDPAGKMDIINGGYISANGKYVRYSRKYWLPRWQFNGTLGWGTLYKGKLK